MKRLYSASESSESTIAGKMKCDKPVAEIERVAARQCPADGNWI